MLVEERRELILAGDADRGFHHFTVLEQQQRRIDRTPYFIGVSGFSSMFSFPMAARPLYSSASPSTAGAIIRQGPHHSAQKSTRTGLSEFSTVFSKSPSVSVNVFSEAIVGSPPPVYAVPFSSLETHGRL